MACLGHWKVLSLLCYVLWWQDVSFAAPPALMGEEEELRGWLKGTLGLSGDREEELLPQGQSLLSCLRSGVVLCQ